MCKAPCSVNKLFSQSDILLQIKFKFQNKVRQKKTPYFTFSYASVKSNSTQETL